MSIHGPILRQLLMHPRRVALVDDRRAYRGFEIVAAAWHVAKAIEAQSKARHVGLLLPTGGAFPIAALAAWMLGRVVVPLNYLLKPEELAFVVRDAEIDCIVTVGPMLEFMGWKGAEGELVVPPEIAGLVRLIKLDELSFKGVPPARWPAGAKDGDLGVLLYTSGTSGKPKGVMLTHGNICANIRQVRDYVDFTTADVMLGVLPQFHSFGLTVLTLLPLMAGLKAVYAARFVPAKIIRLIREHRPTVLVAIPSMYNALLRVKEAGPEDWTSLRYVVSGGEPLPRAVFDAFFEKYKVRLNEGYGLTETAPVTHWCRPSEFRLGSVGGAVGKGASRVRVRIVSIETGKDVGPGTDGEVRLGGPNVMKGYFKREAETTAAFDEQGFLRTGDIGRVDADGHLFITGRLKEMLIVGGENVFPREIEEVLNAHPAVKDCGVVGKADAMRGELPIAFVELEDAGGGGGGEGAVRSVAVEEKELLKWCRERLAGYKVPDEIRFVGALPRNATGKVLRRELKGMV